MTVVGSLMPLRAHRRSCACGSSSAGSTRPSRGRRPSQPSRQRALRSGGSPGRTGSFGSRPWARPSAHGPAWGSPMWFARNSRAGTSRKSASMHVRRTWRAGPSGSVPAPSAPTWTCPGWREPWARTSGGEAGWTSRTLRLTSASSWPTSSS